jgi:phosphoenolpyruvate---glycerone phosphotransferase subunit DhaL
MKDTLTTADIIAALGKLADDLTAAAEQLRELDAAIGDGDLGITMTIGFQAVREVLPTLAGGDIGAALLKSGMAFNRKAASTFGALFATMMMNAAKVSKGLQSVGLKDVAAMVEAAAQGVRERGKANLGDKTLLDALIPASEALKVALAAGATLSEGLERATIAAEEGAQATQGMTSRMGRSSWFAERTSGIQDPGAVAISLMFRSVSAYVQGTAEGRD